MGRESQEALIDLLMRLSSSDDEIQGLSEHERKRREKKFIRSLVQAHERQQHQRKYHKSRAANSAESQSSGGSKSIAAVSTAGIASNTTTNKTSSSSKMNEKVRIELVEAIFKEEKKDSGKKDKKEKKAKKEKKKPSSELKFKEGAKKIMVLPRSTTVKELLKLASNKLKVKKPVRVFLKVSKTTILNLGDVNQGCNDLSGVDDGEIVYVTTTPETTEDCKPSKITDEGVEENSADSSTDAVIETDPLDLVKQAYEQQEQDRRKNRNPRQQAPSGDSRTSIIIDKDQKAKYDTLRAELPAASYKENIIDSVNANRVVVLCGATGCGKSTQVPQFLLEHEEESEQQQDSSVQDNQKYIVVTQPRKVAAIALANRVADERGSPPPGNTGSSVGYMVRGDRRVDERSCRIIYMTVGILLRMLVSQSQSSGATDDIDSSRSSFSIQNISHLIIDEVHERDVNTDFTLTLLKGMMLSKSSTSSNLSHLKLILMSATASSDLFVNYFTGSQSKPPAVLEIPGRTFPVDIKWLPECQDFAGATMWRPNSNNGNEGAAKNQKNEDTDARTALSPRARDKIDDKFIRALIVKIVQKQKAEGQLKKNGNAYRKTGAILVFLPGRGEIESLASCLYDKNTIVGNQEICNILKLHSAIAKNEQQKVFRPALEGTVKIVLATNIAETSVTISGEYHSSFGVVYGCNCQILSVCHLVIIANQTQYCHTINFIDTYFRCYTCY